MIIGIIVAMSKELNLLLPLLENPETKAIDNFHFHTGNIGNNHIVAMQCGIGKVNAAIGTLTMIKNYNTDLIIDSGVAGGADPSVNVMDIVVGSKVAYHDVYCGPENAIGAVQGLPLFYDAPQNIISKIAPSADIHTGLICSGDQFIDTIEQVNRIKSNFPDVLAVDMESAAIAHVCYKKSIEYFCMRIISDSPGAGHNNSVQYDNFWAEAPEHTFELVRQLLIAL